MTSAPQHPDANAQRQMVPTDQQLTQAAWMPPAPMWLDGAPGDEGIDFGTFLHSLRRRWLPALLIGSVLAAVVSSLLFFLIPVSYEAIGLIRVSRLQDTVLEKNNVTFMGLDYEVYKQTQAALVTSPYVLNAAIRTPGIQQTAMVSQEANPIGWLEDELNISYPGDSEILRIGIRGENEKDITKIVDAVMTAYLEEIAHSERTDKTSQLDMLRREEREYMRLIKEKSDVVYKLADELGTADSDAARIRERIEHEALRAISQRRLKVASEFEALQGQLLALNVAQDSQQFLQVSPLDVEDILEQDPIYFNAKQNKDYLEQQMRAAGRQNSSLMLNQLQQQVVQFQQEMLRRRKELEPRAVNRIKKEMGIDSGLATSNAQILQAQVVYKQRALEALNKEFNDQLDKIANIRGFSSDLVTRKNELQGLEETVKEISSKVARLDLEMQSKSRIKLVQPATIPDAGNFKLKIIEVVGGGLLTLLGTLFGIAFWDYQGKRLNSEREIESKCRLPVIGNIPALRGNVGSLFGGRVNESMISDSVDSIRSAIVYGGNGKRINSVVVTSAVGNEGKSTVASQLAVSLARSGRRTLLVDGDIRNPQQHAVFGLPLDRGLCDVLRGEATLEETVQATPAEGLWILPAGRCDIASMQSLSGPGVAAIADNLKSQFDYVILDSGPVLTGPEAMIYGQYVDVAVLATRKDVSRLPKVDEATRRMQSVGVEVLGAVINGASSDVRASQLKIASA